MSQPNSSEYEQSLLMKPQKRTPYLIIFMIVLNSFRKVLKSAKVISIRMYIISILEKTLLKVLIRARGSIVGRGTMLQAGRYWVRVPMW
jgi:hypothetical protein